MRIAETVTFGGSALDRAAGLRKDPLRLADLWRGGQVLLMWRGRPLVALGGGLGWLGTAHGLAGDATQALFLGVDEGGTGLFAQDVSGYEPAETAPAMGGFFDTSVQFHPELGGSLGFGDLRHVMADLSPRDAELAATAKGLLEWHRSHGYCAACGVKSDMVHAGWQRSCPSCATQHFPRTDPVVIMLITRGNSVLLGRGPTWPEGMYSLLAGFMEPGETLEAAVRREVAEESGIRVGAVTYLASQPWPFPASLMIGCHGAAISAAITIDPEELQDARWATREEMMLATAGQHPVIKPGRKGAIARFLLDAWLADRLE